MDLTQYETAHKRDQYERAKQRADEKRKDLEMLINYDPFGKPGGGAPRVSCG